MVQIQSSREWDEEVEDARVMLNQAVREEESARRALGEIRVQSDRAERLVRRGQRMADVERTKTSSARRQAEDARRKGEEARRKAQATFRWEADARRWESEAERAAIDARRWSDEARRHERDSKTAVKEQRVRTDKLTEAMTEVHNWRQRFEYLTKFGRGLTTSNATNAQANQGSLAITDRVIAALSEVMSTLDRRADQCLRLLLAEDGVINLTLDAPRDGHQVLKQGNTPVLIISPQVLVNLGGKTLDVSESSEGTKIIISE